MRTTLENILLAYAFDSMWNDDHDGDVESPTGYFARFIVEDDADAVHILANYIEWADDLPDEFSAGDLVGAWFVWQDSNGSVNYTRRDLAQRVEIDAIYDDTMNEYAAWLDADESEV